MPEGRQAAQVLLERGLPHRVQDEVGAAAVGQPQHLVGELVRRGVDDRVGAALLHQAGLRGARYRPEDAGAGDLGELHRHEPHPAGRRMDEHARPRPRRAGRVKQVIRGQDLDRERGAVGEAHGVRKRDDHPSRGEAVVRIRLAGEHGHPGTRLEIRHALAHRLDHARGLEPRRVREPGLHGVRALTEARVREVHTDRVVLDEYRPRPHIEPGHIGDRQHLRTTELPEDDGSHGVPPGRQMCADGPAGASVKSPSSSYSTVALASGWALDTHPLFLQTSRVP